MAALGVPGTDPIGENSTLLHPVTDPPNLNDLVGDSVFEALKASFVPGKKGRPPHPPKVALTNRLLLQLELLRQTTPDKTYKDVAHWFAERLFPDVSYPADRIKGLIARLKKMLADASADDITCQKFLDNQLDLDFVSPSLQTLGLRRNILLAKEAVSVSGADVTNVVVLDIEQFRKREDCGAFFTIHWMRTLLKLDEGKEEKEKEKENSRLKHTIRKMKENYDKLLRKKGEDHEKNLALFLGQPFILQAAPSSSGKAAPTETEVRLKEAEKKILKQSEQLKVGEEHVAVLSSTVQDLSRDKFKLVEEMKDATEQQRLNLSLQEEVRTLKLTIKELQPERLQRLQDKLQNLKSAEKRADKAEGDLKAAKEAAQEASEEHQRIVDNLERDLRRKKKRVHDQDQRISALQEELKALNSEISAARGEERIETRVREEGNRFKDNIRKTVLALHSQAHIPTTRCSDVIKIVGEGIFDYKFGEKDLPTAQTVSNILDEGQVLANVQIAEKILESSNITLHTDATSRQKKCYVSQQLTLDISPTETLSFGFKTVATEDSATLLQLTINQLGRVAELFAEYSEQVQDEVFRQILSKLTSVMSDRAAVMKKFNTVLLEFLKTKIGHQTVVHFLFCNAHFLIGLQMACETTLKIMEKEVIVASDTKEKLGRDKDSRFTIFGNSSESATHRVIHHTCDLVGPRGDEKNGCRQDWLAHCEEEDVASLMTSYRSNRFNCFFEGAAAVIYHHDHLRSFFPSLEHNNLKIDSLRADLEDSRLMVFVCAVALIFVRITGPYWELLDSRVKYTQLHQYIQAMDNKIRSWEQDSSDLLNPQFPGIFGGEFEIAGKRQRLRDSVDRWASEHKEAVKSALQQLMPGMRDKLMTQLTDFLPGNIYGGPPAEMPPELDHCPLTNLLGENVFGDLDYDINKARNSTTHQRTSTNMLCHNHTSEWLQGKRTAEAANLLAFGRKKGKALRTQNRAEEQAVMLRLRQKLIDSRAKKLAKEAKEAAKKAELIQKLMLIGGPCNTADDVDRLVRRHRQQDASLLLQAIKDQIRYQKTVLLQKGRLRLTGPLEELIEALKDHLDSGDTVEPAARRPHLDEFQELDFGHDEFQPPSFEHTGEWVAVFYDNDFYIGTVTKIISKEKAMVKYLAKSDVGDLFKWPSADDEAETESCYVFKWNLDVNPVGHNMRQWKVSDVEEISRAYLSLK